MDIEFVDYFRVYTNEKAKNDNNQYFTSNVVSILLYTQPVRPHRRWGGKWSVADTGA
jgi:hypothetical protein